MSFHTILKTSKDYYSALKRARQLTQDLEDTINNDVEEEQVQFEIKIKYFEISCAEAASKA